MSDKENMKMCMAVVAVIALVMLVLGFMDMFKHKTAAGGKPDIVTISQQLRGLGFFLLAMVVLSLGSVVCFEGFHKMKPSGMFDMS